VTTVDAGQSDHDFGPPEVDEYAEKAAREREEELMSGPHKLPGPGDGQMRHTPNPEAQLIRDQEIARERAAKEDGEQLAKAAERTRQKGTQR
jgi:hypothetical protein